MKFVASIENLSIFFLGFKLTFHCVVFVFWCTILELDFNEGIFLAYAKISSVKLIIFDTAIVA